MTVYFDKANLEAFLLTKAQAGHAETMKMLRGEVNIAVNCSSTEALSHDLLRPFVMTMTTGQKNTKMRFLPATYPDRPISPTFYQQLQANRRSVVLAVDAEVGACKAEGMCLIGQVGDELPELGRLYRGDKYKFTTPLILGQERDQFSGWDKLTKHVLPFHDLIISDRYLLGERDLFEHNYRGMLEALTKGRRGKINLVLLSLLPKDAEAVTEYQWLRDLTDEIVTGTTGMKPNFTVVWGDYKTDVRHDRHIITNYQWYSSGDSFLYFRPNGSLRTHGDTLTVHSLADAEARAAVDTMLERMQANIKDMLSITNFVQGDRVSSFLTF
ncbi:hypothetical protein GCM10022408_38130 [Hymenobacter fastidiosus]|uniref:Uncharacterized protein n=1 Tax=Hymenobacter fastidiosus TaxID=486264 RepID=A0ABP7T397_9BACT